MEWIHRPILVCVLILWLPLVVLTALSGTFVGGVDVPFVFDLANIRLLVLVPVLIGAERLVHTRLRTIVAQFLERGLIAPEDRAQFDTLIARAMRMRNSIAAEAALFIISLTVGYWVWHTYVSLNVTTWTAVPARGSMEFTWAGYWYAFVSLPVARFISMRWCFRLFIWYSFLWRISRLRLRLNPLHPDRAGGLGFLASTVHAFGPILIAFSAFLSSVIGAQILYEGRRLPEFKLEIAIVAVLLMLIVIFPLLFFASQLVEAKLEGLREFGRLASRYSHEFREKWITGEAPPEEPLLGSGDIQSLADLANSFQVVKSMRPVPFDRELFIELAILIGLPLLPLALTMFSVEEMMERMLKLIA